MRSIEEVRESLEQQDALLLQDAEQCCSAGERLQLASRVSVSRALRLLSVQLSQRGTV